MGELIFEYLEKYPDIPSRTLAATLFKEHPEIFASIEHARKRVRYYRDADGNQHNTELSDKRFVRPKQKAGWTYPLPPSLSKPWIPEEVSATRTLVFSDVHIPFHDIKAIEAMIKFGIDYIPKLIILNGDIFDFYELSKFVKDPRLRNFGKEIEAGKAFLAYLRERFPKTEIIWKLGNHEERWQVYLFTRAPAVIGTDIWEYEKLMDCANYGVKVIQDKRIIMLGKLPVIHGHEFFSSMYNPVNPARGLFLRGIHTALAGHWHQPSDHVERTLSGKVIKTWSAGCLCDLHPQYARLNKWAHGFITVDSTNGSFQVDNHTISDGKIM